MVTVVQTTDAPGSFAGEAQRRSARDLALN
jgi:hypothetical protein